MTFLLDDCVLHIATDVNRLGMYRTMARLTVPLLTVMLLVVMVQLYVNVRLFKGNYSPAHCDGPKRLDAAPKSSNPVDLIRVQTNGVSNVVEATKESSQNRTEKYPCSYKIQLYDKDKQFARLQRRELQYIIEGSQGNSTIRAELQCGRSCSLEVTVADEKNNFTGMDAVVFHLTRYITPKPPPPRDMNPSQAWIFFSWESPRMNAEQTELTRLAANAVWTYHRQSDLTTAFGGYRPGVPMQNETKTAKGWLEGKTKFIAWMASNCKDTSWPRRSFVRELQRHIPIDIYGICGRLKCKPYGSTYCNVYLLRKYKFYLSLENSECEEYITEKLWEKPLMQGVVPVVYGPKRKVYEELLPPNSFIYIGDYKNAKELASYLRLLDSKPELYAKYLEWRYHGSVWATKPLYGPFDPSIFCNLIPVIEKVRGGELKRRPIVEHNFTQTCRKAEDSKTRQKAAFGVGDWIPW